MVFSVITPIGSIKSKSSIKNETVLPPLPSLSLHYLLSQLTVVSCSNDGTVVLWAAPSSSEGGMQARASPIRTFRCHDDFVKAFSITVPHTSLSPPSCPLIPSVFAYRCLWWIGRATGSVESLSPPLPVFAGHGDTPLSRLFVAIGEAIPSLCCVSELRCP